MEQAEAGCMLVNPFGGRDGDRRCCTWLSARWSTCCWCSRTCLALFCGGIWALLLTHTNFSISAAVGFISIFGVAVMNGLLLVSSFHRLRLDGLPHGGSDPRKGPRIGCGR